MHHERGFIHQAYEDIECPDCRDNRLSPPEGGKAHKHPGRLLKIGACVTCGGKERIPNPIPVDPMSLKARLDTPVVAHTL